jgi:hypothetical protein
MTPEEAKLFAENWHDPMWRLCESGCYKILIKDTEGNSTGMMPFVANRTQRRFLKKLHYRNIILKARQLGFTTLVCLMWLDYALFNQNARCGIVAQDDTAATSFFRDKVKFAYDQLDPEIKAMFPLSMDSANELRFGHNNSSIRVATSFASATLHRLLISEYAKICAKHPEKANEVVIGTLPTVPETGLIIIESTGEGAEGDYYARVQLALKAQQEGRVLSPKDFAFHFYGWFIDPAYTVNPNLVSITPEITKYLNEKEIEVGQVFTPGQRAWYAVTLASTFSGVQEKMFQQYPTTPDEPFFVSSGGVYFMKEMAAVRTSGRICNIPETDVPVNTFWDIGTTDGTAIWFHQTIGMEDRFIGYFEAHDENLSVYVKELQRRGYIYNKHFLPHDAFHKRLSDTNDSIAQMLEKLYPGQEFEKVSKISDLNTGIQITKAQFPSAYFDRAGTKEGVDRIDRYSKRRNPSVDLTDSSGKANPAAWHDDPNKANGCSEGADAFRQWGQVKAAGNLTMRGNVSQQDSGYYREAPDWRL